MNASITPAETGAHPLILDRPEAEAHVRHFDDVLTVLEDMVDYGTHLIVRCWVSSPRSTTDMVVLAVLLKQIVGLLDAAGVLLRKGCVDPAFLELRALFEASVCLEWILKRDSARRARAYRIANLRRALKWAKRATTGTPESRAFRAELRVLPGRPWPTSPKKRKEAAAEITRLQQALSEPWNRQMNQAFERRKRGLIEPDWYRVLFPKKRRVSLRVLARQVRRLPEYRIIYEPGSETAHSTRSDAHVRIGSDGLRLVALRNLTPMSDVCSLLLSVTLHAFSTVIEHYRPGESAVFAKTYGARWRKAYLTTRRVEYVYVEQTIA